MLWLFLIACTGMDSDSDTDLGSDLGTEADTDTDTMGGPDPFADRVVLFSPGEGAGFGEPELALGGPRGLGTDAGSLHVVSLGCGGQIDLAFDGDLIPVDGPGVDLLVFENAFVGFTELGEVSASVDGIDWLTWPCNTDTLEGCAGVTPTAVDADPSDPDNAGGDAYDLEDIGLTEARFVRVTDAGVNGCAAPSGGFDLDAVAAVTREPAG